MAPASTTTTNASATNSDEALARALAQEEQELASSLFIRRLQQQQQQQQQQQGRSIPIVQGRQVPSSSSSSSQAPTTRQSNPSSSSSYPASSSSRAAAASSTTYSTPSSTTRQVIHAPSGWVPGAAAAAALRQPPPSGPPPHMCIVPCVMTDAPNPICVEMMVDTGAQTSVMSLSLAYDLGLVDQINRRFQGIAAGVGQAKIVGKLFGVACELGQVEFRMDFSVLDMGRSNSGSGMIQAQQDKLLLLGLDLMRQYKCLVDLEGDKLIFGGVGGVEVPMLPAEQTLLTTRYATSSGCPIS